MIQRFVAQHWRSLSQGQRAASAEGADLVLSERFYREATGAPARAVSSARAEAVGERHRDS